MGQDHHSKPRAQVESVPPDPKLQVARETYRKDRAQLEEILPALHKIASGIGANWNPASEEPAREGELLGLQVEPLLQQAASLLDSVLSAQGTYRDVRIQQLNLSLDLGEMEQLQSIHDDEVAAGVFNVPAWSGEASVESDNAAKTSQAAFSDWVQQQALSQKANAVWTAENNSKPFLQFDATEILDHTPQLGAGLATWAGSSDENTKIVSGQPPKAASTIAAVLSYRASDYGFSYLQQQMTAQIAPVAARLPYLVKYATYMASNAGFRERGRIVANNKLTAKLAAFSAPDGILNYSVRLASIVTIARSSLAEAEIRLRTVRRGARQVFGVESPTRPEAQSSSNPPRWGCWEDSRSAGWAAPSTAPWRARARASASALRQRSPQGWSGPAIR